MTNRLWVHLCVIDIIFITCNKAVTKLQNSKCERINVRTDLQPRVLRCVSVNTRYMLCASCCCDEVMETDDDECPVSLRLYLLLPPPLFIWQIDYGNKDLGELGPDLSICSCQCESEFSSAPVTPPWSNYVRLFAWENKKVAALSKEATKTKQFHLQPIFTKVSKWYTFSFTILTVERIKTTPQLVVPDSQSCFCRTQLWESALQAGQSRTPLIVCSDTSLTGLQTYLSVY